jgi:uncharacterized protein
LRSLIRELGSVVVAYSGGVDSSVVLRVAHDVLGANAVGVIGRSDSYAARELRLALEQAEAFGAEVEIVSTGELADPEFRANASDRCYHCKSELYRGARWGGASDRGQAILDGTILTTSAIGGPAAARPSSTTCARRSRSLASPRRTSGRPHRAMGSRARTSRLAVSGVRIPYGTEITREILAMVEQGEELLRSLGFSDLRLRHHGEVARIEVPANERRRLLEPAISGRSDRGSQAFGISIHHRGPGGLPLGQPHEGLERQSECSPSRGKYLTTRLA